MAPSKGSLAFLSITASALLVVGNLQAQTPHVVYAKQGTSMRTTMDNRGVFGRAPYPQASPPLDSMGVEYPIGSRFEHISGAGLWVGGLIDTSRGVASKKMKAVTTGYESYGGVAPLYEFYPGPSLADSIWRVYGTTGPRPPGWDKYWGSSLPYHPVADQNFYCAYTDYYRIPTGHFPLDLKVIQSSFTWDSQFASGIQIIRYFIINTGWRVIDSSYVGLFSDSEVGLGGVPNYFFNNFSAFDYYSGVAYSHNPVDSGSTPVGILFLDSPPASRTTFKWYTVADSPLPDGPKYDMMSSGAMSPSEYPSLSDTRFLYAKGPYTLQPGDTLRIAIALLCSPDLWELETAATHARELYHNVVLAEPQPDNGQPNDFALEQNFPNPFNPTTTINYDLPIPVNVRLTVYDVLGKEVSTLVDGPELAGHHHATFDGSAVASGVYFYRLTAGAFTNVKKLMLLK